MIDAMIGKFDERYMWTAHSRMKMRQYRLTESRIQRIIRYPARVEEGIMPNAIAVMSPAGGRQYSEIWAMYVFVGGRTNFKSQILNHRQRKMKIITAWRYPGKSPIRDPIPAEILQEIKDLL